MLRRGSVRAVEKDPSWFVGDFSCCALTLHLRLERKDPRAPQSTSSMEHRDIFADSFGGGGEEGAGAFAWV
jgi:hypothetical protein